MAGINKLSFDAIKDRLKDEKLRFAALGVNRS